MLAATGPLPPAEGNLLTERNAAAAIGPSKAKNRWAVEKSYPMRVYPRIESGGGGGTRSGAQAEPGRGGAFSARWPRRCFMFAVAAGTGTVVNQRKADFEPNIHIVISSLNTDQEKLRNRLRHGISPPIWV